MSKEFLMQLDKFLNQKKILQNSQKLKKITADGDYKVNNLRYQRNNQKE